MRRLLLPCLVAAIAVGFAALGAGAAAGNAEGQPHLDRVGDAAAPLDLRSASLRQRGRRLVLSVGTRGPWGVGALRRFPDADGTGSRRGYLCLRLHQSGVTRQLCVGPRDRRGRDRLWRARLDGGKAVRRGAIRAKVSRSSSRAIRIAFSPWAAGLRTGRIAWLITSRASAASCAAGETGDPCVDRMPDGGDRLSTRLKPVPPTGCTPRGASLRTHGPRGRKLVALTFDDGPGPDTTRVLRVLRRFGARATFFVIGEQVRADARALKRVLRAGGELANHSMHHTAHPSATDLAATSAEIRRSTGFRPCLFRPPGGAVDTGLVQRAGGEGMTTVTWDVDPRDWAGASAGAIRSAVLGGVRPGSIVVMHDGGGDRSQTVAALPGILKDLRRRGYKAVTVTKLLGQRFTY